MKKDRRERTEGKVKRETGMGQEEKDRKGEMERVIQRESGRAS